MKTIVLELPVDVPLEPADARMILAAKLYERGVLSSGQAAKLAGISKRAFIETLGDYGVSLFSNNPEDLQSEIINACHSRR